MPGARIDSGRKLQVDSESGGNSDSDSARDSEAAGAADASARRRPQTRSASKLHLICQGCNKSFANKQSLRRHWNAWKTADPACRNAATKRPRTGGRVDSAAARDTDDRIQQMVGDRSNRGQAASDAQSPFLQPRDEVLGPARVTVPVRLGFTGLYNVCILFATGLQQVCNKFALGLLLFFQVCTRFGLGLYLVCTASAAGGRPGRRPSGGGPGTALA